MIAEVNDKSIEVIPIDAVKGKITKFLQRREESRVISGERTFSLGIIGDFTRGNHTATSTCRLSRIKPQESRARAFLSFPSCTTRQAVSQKPASIRLRKRGLRLLSGWVFRSYCRRHMLRARDGAVWWNSRAHRCTVLYKRTHTKALREICYLQLVVQTHLPTWQADSCTDSDTFMHTYAWHAAEIANFFQHVRKNYEKNNKDKLQDNCRFCRLI